MAKTAKPPADSESLRGMLVERKATLKPICPLGIGLDEFIRDIIHEFQNNPALYRTEPRTLRECLERLDRAGLRLGGIQPQAYLVPYGDRCQVLVSYHGLLHIARVNGVIRRHKVESVHEGDHFEYVAGLRPRVTHIPRSIVRVFPTLTHVYAHFILADDEELICVMTKGEIEEHREKWAKAGSADAPWNKAPIQMAKKTVVRRPFLQGEIPLTRIAEEHRFVFTDGDFSSASSLEPPVTLSPPREKTAQPPPDAIEKAPQTAKEIANANEPPADDHLFPTHEQAD